MSKHHHQSKAEQIYNKAHGLAAFHSEKMYYQASGSMKPGGIPTKVAVDNDFLQLRAYQIYPQKGRPALLN